MSDQQELAEYLDDPIQYRVDRMSREEIDATMAIIGKPLTSKLKIGKPFKSDIFEGVSIEQKEEK